MAIDAGYAAWLQAEALFTSRVDSTLNTRWGTKAVEAAMTSALALKADAETQADRDLVVLGGPLVRDKHLVQGARRDLIGRPVTITIDRLGYTGGKPAFVIGADEQENGTTILTVIRSLAA